MILAPGINIKRDPLCGRNFDNMSEDPYLIETLAVPFIQGVQENDVAACVKHFALNCQETERLWVDTIVDERTLQEIYLPGFRAAVQEGGSYSLMNAYNKVNGVHCSENKELLDNILRRDWKYDGTVISDWGSVHTTKEAAESALDIEMSVTYDFDDYFFAKPLLEAVKNGEVTEASVDEKVRNILRMMFRLKMIGPEAAQRKAGSYDVPEHWQGNLDTAREAIVLLKNEEHVLPITEERLRMIPAEKPNRAPGKRRIAVIGHNGEHNHAGGGGSAEIKALYEISPLLGLKKALGGNVDVVYAQGYYIPSKKDENEVNWQESSLERQVMNEENPESPKQQALLDINPNTIVTLVAGSPVEMPWRDRVKALLWCYYSGMETGDALSEILLGKANPSAKLPETFPVRYADTVTAKNGQFGREDKIICEEGIFVGYRYYEKEKITPAFAFGHGLSYTTFDLKDLQLIPATDAQTGTGCQVKVTVTNTGDVAGAEVIQCYVTDCECSVERPVKELKAYRKVFLQPGETKEVTMELGESAFAFYDVEKKAFTVEPGKFVIHVGNASDHCTLQGEIVI